MSLKPLHCLLLNVTLLGAALPAAAQDVTLPPNGDNQRCSVTQGIGLVSVRIDYSSPDVHGPGGEDRSGKIWGDLVPYGLHDLRFNDCTECPWRAGANENTVFTVSHDVLVEGKRLPAGRYGLHMIAGASEWTIIFSKNSSSWGSFSYTPTEDALRVTVKPAAREHQEWLTYEFIDRRPTRATVALRWEKLEVPWTIEVDNMPDLYVANLKDELRGFKGYTWINIRAAADYCLQNKTHLDQALIWAKEAVEKPFFGQANLSTLGTLARAQLATGHADDAARTIDRALTLAGPAAPELHQFARQFQQAGYKTEALKIFQGNAKRYPNAWPVQLGLARGHMELNDPKTALGHAKKALAQAPDDASRKSVERLIQQLEGAEKK